MKENQKHHHHHHAVVPHGVGYRRPWWTAMFPSQKSWDVWFHLNTDILLPLSTAARGGALLLNDFRHFHASTVNWRLTSSRYIRCTCMLSALELFWVMRYTNLLFTYLLTYFRPPLSLCQCHHDNREHTERQRQTDRQRDIERETGRDREVVYNWHSTV